MQAQTAELNTDIKKTLRETMNLDSTNDEYVARLTRYTEENTNEVSWSNWITKILIPFIIVIFYLPECTRACNYMSIYITK